MTIEPKTDLTVFDSNGMAARNMLGGVNKNCSKLLSFPVREVIAHARRVERNVKTEYVWTRTDPLRNGIHETCYTAMTKL